jgi:hypothetical protein
MLNPLKWKYEDQARLLFAAAFGAAPHKTKVRFTLIG